MTTNEIFAFNIEVTRFINDTMCYVRESFGENATAQNALDYYVCSAEAEDPNNPTFLTLADEQKEQFLHVAEHILREGFYPHA